MEIGFYEKIVTRKLKRELDDFKNLIYSSQSFTANEAAIYINRFFQAILKYTFEQLNTEKEENAKRKMISISNELISVISEHLDEPDLLGEKIDEKGEILKACFNTATFPEAELKDYIKLVYPFTGLSESELFTGSRTGVNLESELKKEMLTADEIWWLISFVKFEGVRLFGQVFEKLQASGKKVKIICTVYMGATDIQAIDFLSKYSNVEIKISYNTNLERLHAKSYLFLRSTGFHTGYIGSSNLSRSALTNGLEWNVKITNQEIPHVLSKCRSTFETYWNDPNFELYDPETHRDRLLAALNSSKYSNSPKDNVGNVFFNITPFYYQQEVLDQLENCRQNGERRNLIIAATGTGKTMIAAFDFNRFIKENPESNFLFVAHREEILRQAQYAFRQVLRNNEFGELWCSGHNPTSYKHLFVSIQTLNNRIEKLSFNYDFFDYIVIDEVHHSAAQSYQKLLEFFQPQILIGLTATPERHDGVDISKYFGHSISAEIRLPEALNRGLLCPFQYFGVADYVDLSGISWRKGRYDVTELEKVYCEDNRRASDVIKNCYAFLKNVHEVCALGFCVSIKHATFMANQFIKNGFKADCLSSENSNDRSVIIQKLQRKEINYLFVVDMFNEGVDIPEVDTLLFLRPTESMTIFLQQFGRGLRLHEDKICLTVLDFVGRQNREYSFEHKFRAMLGKTHTKVKTEIEKDFPNLPLGCSIILERQVKETILNSIDRVYRGGLKSLRLAIQKFKADYDLPLTLKNFCEYTGIGLYKIYNTNERLLWFELVELADFQTCTMVRNAKLFARLLGNVWLAVDSKHYFQFIRDFLRGGAIEVNNLSHQQMMLMLYGDIYNKAPLVSDHKQLHMLLNDLFAEDKLRFEILEYLNYRLEQLSCIEKPISLRRPVALKLHGRYTRGQILTCFGENNLERRATSREGVYRLKSLNTEILFVTLDKNAGQFNPSTMYQDYFISDELFHWQSQNSTSQDSVIGQSYINQYKNEKDVLLFAREATKDENGVTMAFVFCGKLKYVQHFGSKPMSITWKMEHAPPALLLREGRKLAAS